MQILIFFRQKLSASLLFKVISFFGWQLWNLDHVIFWFLFFLNLHLSLGTSNFNICVLYNPCIIRLSIFVMFGSKFIILILFLKIFTLWPLYVRVVKVLQRAIFEQWVRIFIKRPLGGTQKLVGGVYWHSCGLTLSDYFCHLLEFLRPIDNVIVYHVDAIRLVHI